MSTLMDRLQVESGGDKANKCSRSAGKLSSATAAKRSFIGVVIEVGMEPEMIECGIDIGVAGKPLAQKATNHFLPQSPSICSQHYSYEFATSSDCRLYLERHKQWFTGPILDADEHAQPSVQIVWPSEWIFGRGG